MRRCTRPWEYLFHSLWDWQSFKRPVTYVLCCVPNNQVSVGILCYNLHPKYWSVYHVKEYWWNWEYYQIKHASISFSPMTPIWFMHSHHSPTNGLRVLLGNRQIVYELSVYTVLVHTLFCICFQIIRNWVRKYLYFKRFLKSPSTRRLYNNQWIISTPYKTQALVCPCKLDHVSGLRKTRSQQVSWKTFAFTVWMAGRDRIDHITQFHCIGGTSISPFQFTGLRELWINEDGKLGHSRDAH